MDNTETTRFTATLPESAVAELKKLVTSHQIPSVNYAIRQAVYDYLAQVRKRQYAQMMKEAAKDKALRTIEAVCCNGSANTNDPTWQIAKSGRQNKRPGNAR